jgi:hypothetical protein
MYFFYLIEQHSQVFVTYLTGTLYVHPLWFYKRQRDNRHSWNVSTLNALSMLFAAILLNCAASGEMHNYCTPRIIKEKFKNFLIHRCNYILLSQVCCVWQVVKTLTIIFNNPVFWYTGPIVMEEPPALAFWVKSPNVKMKTAGFS